VTQLWVGVMMSLVMLWTTDGVALRAAAVLAAVTAVQQGGG
jgi:hypothetical protein